MSAKVKPILFNTEMVRAIMGGRKTVTRRLVKPQPHGGPRLASDLGEWFKKTQPPDRLYEKEPPFRLLCPPYNAGDILYVRETWCDPSGTGYPILYKAAMPMHWDEAETEIGIPVTLKAEDCTWRPSIHMPREAARIFLRVTGVSMSPLQYVGNAEAKDEGCTCCAQFIRMWDRMIKPKDRLRYGWVANPYVWVIEFERCEKPEGHNI